MYPLLYIPGGRENTFLEAWEEGKGLFETESYVAHIGLELS